MYHFLRTSIECQYKKHNTDKEATTCFTHNVPRMHVGDNPVLLKHFKHVVKKYDLRFCFIIAGSHAEPKALK